MACPFLPSCPGRRDRRNARARTGPGLHSPVSSRVSRPVVFVNSTVFDFADLRSAVRYWLEEYGFEARTSVTPDFPHPLDRKSREAAWDKDGRCSIAQAGSYVPRRQHPRVVGWYGLELAGHLLERHRLRPVTPRRHHDPIHAPSLIHI